jgi:hypothetical protein
MHQETKKGIFAIILIIVIAFTLVYMSRPQQDDTPKFIVEEIQPIKHSPRYCQDQKAWRVVYPNLYYKGFNQETVDSLLAESILNFQQFEYFAQEKGVEVENFHHDEMKNHEKTTVGFTFCVSYEISKEVLIEILEKAH